MGRPKEIAAARGLNFAMFALLLALACGFSVWAAGREIGLMVQAHGAKLGDHLARIALFLQPLPLLVGLALAWRRRRRAARHVE